MYKFVDIPTEILAIICEFCSPRIRINIAMMNKLDYKLLLTKYPRLFNNITKIAGFKKTIKYYGRTSPLKFYDELDELSFTRTSNSFTIPESIKFIKNVYMKNAYGTIYFNNVPIENLMLQYSCSTCDINPNFVKQLILINHPIYYGYKCWPNVTHLTLKGLSSEPDFRLYLNFTRFPKLEYLDIIDFNQKYDIRELKIANNYIDTCKMNMNDDDAFNISTYESRDIEPCGKSDYHMTFKNAIFNGIKFGNLIVNTKYIFKYKKINHKFEFHNQ